MNSGDLFLRNDHTFLQAGVPITTASFYGRATKEQLRDVFKGHNDSEIPLFDERVEILHQAGQTLLEVGTLLLPLTLKKISQVSHKIKKFSP